MTKQEQTSAKETRPQRPPLAVRKPDLLEEYQRQLNTLMDNFWGFFSGLPFYGSWPGILLENMPTMARPHQELMRLWGFDVAEKEREIVVSAQIPGFEENDVDVQLKEGHLEIDARRQQELAGDEFRVNYHRTVTLPVAAGVTDVATSYHNGVLEMHIPKPAYAAPQPLQAAPVKEGAKALKRRTHTKSSRGGNGRAKATRRKAK